MGESSTNILNLSVSALNSLKKSDLIQKILDLKNDIEGCSKDIEGCHRLPLSRNSWGQDKRVIVKFVDRKHSEVLLRDKKRISSKSFNHLNVPKNFLSWYPFAHITDTYGVSARIYKGKTR